LQEGKRLENLTWRIYSRETFCCKFPHRYPLKSSSNFARRTSSPDSLPELSSSLESRFSLDSDMATPESELPERFGQLSMGESRKHISPIDLENIVKSVTESNGLEDLILPASLQSLPKHTTPPQPQPPQPSQPEIHVADAEQDSPDTAVSASATEEESSNVVDTLDVMNDGTAASETHIVRGFSKDHISLSRRSKTQLATTPQPVLKTSPQMMTKSYTKKKGNASFMLGGGSDEGEESSLDSHFASHSLRDQVASKEERSTMQSRMLESEEAIDDSDDEHGQSAIEDDDDWEDEPEAPLAALPPTIFQRQESITHLSSRKSLITDQLHEKDRAAALRIAASRSTPALRSSRSSSHNGPMVSPPREAVVQRSRLAVGSGVGALAVQTGALPAATAGATATSSSDPVEAPALSPRTNRRIMLQTELTSSLRINMLWERQQKANQAKLSKQRKCQSEIRLSNLAERAPEPYLSSGYEEPKLGDGEAPENVFDKGASLYFNHGW
jgi:hypothetical protein